MTQISLTFARPALLLLLLLLPLLIALTVWMGRRRRMLLERFGQLEALAGLSTLQPRSRGRTRLCLLGAVLFLVIGLAGPRWGKGDPGVVAGRDVMIVLDLSKSMLADDMDDASNKERWQAAQAGIRELLVYMRQHGGHRVGLIVFAAKPWLVCPLTNDYDHFEMRLNEFSPNAPPPEVNPDKEDNLPSGTRIGAAVAEGAKWHDARYSGSQDLLLISDGDDPAPDVDDEIKIGIDAAREAKIPVYVVGVGDPDNATTVTTEHDVFKTKLMELPLKRIAGTKPGTKSDEEPKNYLRSLRDKPTLRDFFQTRIEPGSPREITDDVLPQPRDRAVLFLMPALVLLLMAWWIEP